MELKDDSRTAILNAAEQIFADRGFLGASVRDICALANANSGLIAYYFRNKDGLFEQVIDRRRAELLTLFEQEMRVAASTGQGEHGALRIVNAYVGFLLRMTADKEWGAYMRLLAKSAAAYDEAIVGDMLTLFEPMPELILQLLANTLPNHDREEIRKKLFYLEASLATIMSSGHFLQRRMKVTLAQAHATLARQIAGYFSASL